jgi:hypothetical protein
MLNFCFFSTLLQNTPVRMSKETGRVGNWMKRTQLLFYAEGVNVKPEI